MRCFQHFDREALGSCVGCGKGVCLDCLNKVQGKIYCGSCESASSAAPGSSTLSSSLSSLSLNGINRISLRQTMSSPAFAATTVYTDKNRFFAALLAFIVGTFGVHKFYLNQPGWGFLYLLFCWTGIPSFAGFLEGVLYLVRSDEDFVRRYGQPMLAAPAQAPTLMTTQVQKLPSTPKEHEKFLLQYAQRHRGQISMAHLMTEFELRLDKVEDALASLSAKGIVVSEIDDTGHVRYFVPEFRRDE